MLALVDSVQALNAKYPLATLIFLAVLGVVLLVMPIVIWRAIVRARKVAEQQFAEAKRAAALQANLLAEIVKTIGHGRAGEGSPQVVTALAAIAEHNIKSAERAYLRLSNIERLTEHTNELLQWLGDRSGGAPPEHSAAEPDVAEEGKSAG